MSVNDPLPWIARELDLIREGADRQLPVLGHCLGGQLISKALGGEITANPVREIGWHPVRKTQTTTATDWLGGIPEETIEAAVIDQLQLDMTPGQLMGDATIAASDSTNEIQTQCMSVSTRNPSSTGFTLVRVYPNPFAHELHVQCQVDRPGKLRISLQDVLGKEVQVLVDHHFLPGSYDLVRPVSDLPEGVYVY